jgi:flagellar hook-length control protein FliK
MAETVESLRDLVHVASARGAAHARLQLHPAELGGIEVRLKLTAEGLTAAISADRPEAAQALQQAGAELRRALEDRGVTVVSLEVTVADPHAGREGAERDLASSGDPRADQARGDSSRGRDAADQHGDEPDTGGRSASAPVPAGAIVDVMA